MPTRANERGKEMSMQFGPMVFCTFSQRETFTRVLGKAFCGDCGATDHEQVTA